MNVHPTAVIHPGARLHETTEIGPYTVVGQRVVLGPGCRIGAFCELGVVCNDGDVPLRLEGDAIIRSHSVVYAGSTFETGLRTGHRVMLREGLAVGPDCQVGTLADFEGDSTMGRSFRTHSNVHIGKHSRIGDFVWIYPNVVLTNDPHPPSDVHVGVTVEDFAVIATMTTVLPGLVIGRGSLVGAETLVRRDVPPGRIVSGVPGEDRGPVDSIKHRRDGLPAYPWRRHFSGSYPPDAVAGWQAEDFSSDALLP